MKTVKTIINDDVEKAMLGMYDWFFSQNEYEEGELLVVIRPHEATEVHFIVEEA